MTLLYFILILGITICIHEFGHFLFAKKSGIYCYEFSIGMGPRILKFRRKNDETEYSLRLFPIGGYVSMAGEQVEVDPDIPKEKLMNNRPWIQRFLTVAAGVLFNFILAIVLLFIVGLVKGVPNYHPVIGEVVVDSPAYKAGVKDGSTITAINGKKTNSFDKFILEYQVYNGKELVLETDKGTYKVKPIKENDNYVYGLKMDSSVKTGILNAIEYSFTKFFSLMGQMIMIIWYLITGNLGLDSLAGPVGIYNIVGQSSQAGFINLVYLTALLCINVGFLNLLPIPAFDGCRLLFLLIEKIKGSPVDPKIENRIHSVGLILLIILMIVITFNDIHRLIR